MKLIYEGWAGIKLAPDLAVDDVTESPSFGWLYAKHPDGQWVTLADLRLIFPSSEMLRAENAQMKGELASKQADLETALNEMGKDDKELEYLNEQLDALRGKVRGWGQIIEDEEITLVYYGMMRLKEIPNEMREAVGDE